MTRRRQRRRPCGAQAAAGPTCGSRAIPTCWRKPKDDEPYARGDEGEIGQETKNKKKHGGKVKQHRRRDGGGKQNTRNDDRRCIRSTAPTSAARGGRKRLASGGSSGLSLGALPGGIPWIPQIAITPGHGAPNPPAVPADQSAQAVNAFANLLAKAGSNQGSSNNQTPVDTGYAIYNDGTPIGIKGVAPFAGSAQDISVGSKRGGRVRNERKRQKKS